MITQIEDYFTRGCGRCSRFATPACSTRTWAGGLADLRAICRDAGLEETLRWGHPCYRHAGRNVAIIGAFRQDFRLSFFNPGLLSDPEGVLERQGPNSGRPGTIRFTDSADVPRRAAVIRAYLLEAMDHAARGLKDAPQPREVALPDELIEALDMDPELAEAFAALTPGRQRSYALNLNGAKKPETRIARIRKFRDRIIAGKGATEL